MCLNLVASSSFVIFILLSVVPTLTVCRPLSEEVLDFTGFFGCCKCDVVSFDPVPVGLFGGGATGAAGGSVSGFLLIGILSDESCEETEILLTFFLSLSFFLNRASIPAAGFHERHCRYL